MKDRSIRDESSGRDCLRLTTSQPTLPVLSEATQKGDLEDTFEGM